MYAFWILGFAICAVVFFLLGSSRTKKPASTTEEKAEATGVQNLIEKIKKDGINTLDKEMKRKRKEDEEELSKIKKLAQEKIDKQLKDTEKELKKKNEQFENSLRLAARDFILQLKNQLENELLSKAVQKDLQDVLIDPDFLKEVILTMAGKFADKKGEVTELSLLIPKKQLGKLKQYFLGRSKEQLTSQAKKGGTAQLTFAADEAIAGFKIGIKGKNIVFDFTLEPLIESLVEYIRPEFQQYFFTKTQQE
jgi:V/A-type H+-transporting ATPase subunit E